MEKVCCPDCGNWRGGEMPDGVRSRHCHRAWFIWDGKVTCEKPNCCGRVAVMAGRAVVELPRIA